MPLAAPVMHAVLPEKSKHLRRSALLVVIDAIKSVRLERPRTEPAAKEKRRSEQCAFWLPPFLAGTRRIGLHKRYGRSHLANKIVSAYIDCAGDFNLLCNGRVFEQANSRLNWAQCGGNRPFSFILPASGAV
jgi:hypothetical protein